MRIVVLDAASLCFPRNDWAELDAMGEVVWFDQTPHDDLSLIAQRCKGAQVILSNKVPLSREVFALLPELKLISVLATGYNIVDIAAAEEAGVTVCNVRGYSTNGVAQQTVAMILHACHHLDHYAESVRAGDWIGCPDFFYLPRTPRELSELTIGIIGFGTIGQRVGSLLAAFGARMIASQRNSQPMPPWDRFAFASIPDILAQADIVSLHCPQTPETTGMINEASLALMKRGAWLVNTARGGLIDETALAATLTAGHLAGAWLDVVSMEPMRADNPLRTIPNCFITPHIAWASESSRRRLLRETVDNLRAFNEGSPRNVVVA